MYAIVLIHFLIPFAIIKSIISMQGKQIEKENIIGVSSLNDSNSYLELLGDIEDKNLRNSLPII